MQNIIFFGNQFFELPILEALAYIVAFLLVGAAIVHLSKRAMGIRTEPTVYTTELEQEPYEPYRGEWEWRKAA